MQCLREGVVQIKSLFINTYSNYSVCVNCLINCNIDVRPFTFYNVLGNGQAGMEPPTSQGAFMDILKSASIYHRRSFKKRLIRSLSSPE